jgi:allene oxide cyclase
VVSDSWQCSLTTWLPKGSLVVEGPFYDTRGSTMAITGGTGAYSRARGVMHLQAHNDQGTAFRFGFVLR